MAQQQPSDEYHKQLIDCGQMKSSADKPTVIFQGRITKEEFESLKAQSHKLLSILTTSRNGQVYKMFAFQIPENNKITCIFGVDKFVRMLLPNEKFTATYEHTD